MKKFVCLILIAGTLSGIYSCSKKTDRNDNDSASFNKTITGKWDIKNDYVVSGVGAVADGINYVGTSADYFDFRTDNRLYTKEGTTLDTFTYKMQSDSILTIGSTAVTTANGISFVAFLKSFTSNSATVVITPSLANPGSVYIRTISLTR